MADPVSSLTPSYPDNACFDEEACSAASSAVPPSVTVDSDSDSLQCPAVEPNACESSVAVKSLVDRFSPANSVSFVQGTPSSEPAKIVWPSENNAQRTTARTDDFSPYAAAGKMADGQGVFAGAALLKTHISSGLTQNTELELLSASAQGGLQSEAQVGVLRAGIVSTPLYVADASLSAEALTARANLGILNDDGSVGVNFGAGAALAGLEATISRSGWSFTTGLSAGLGGYVSAGFRDADHDGQPEVCGKLSISVVTVGACIEEPF